MIKKNIDKNYNVKFYFKEPTPQNKMTGLKPKSKFEMNNEYKKEQHPVFGDANQRLSWHKKLKKFYQIQIRILNSLIIQKIFQIEKDYF